jgi:hypothetical protein
MLRASTLWAQTQLIVWLRRFLMDLATASAAVALLSPYLGKAVGAAAGEAGKAAWKAGETLFQTIRQKFSAKQDSYAETTLQRLQEQPENEGRQTALAQVLAEQAQDDPGFAREIEQLLQDAKQDEQVNQFMTQVYGKAWVGKITNIGSIQADNVSF